MTADSLPHRPLLLTRALPYKAEAGQGAMTWTDVLQFRSTRHAPAAIVVTPIVPSAPGVLHLTDPAPRIQGWCDLALQDSFVFRSFAANSR